MLNPAQNKAIDDYIEFSGTEGYCWPFFPEPKISNLKRKILSTEPWKSNITEVDLENILFKIQIKLTKNNIPDDYTGLFRDLPQGKEVMFNLKKHIIEYLESIPRNYYFFAPIHGLPDFGSKEIPVTKQITIISTKSELDFSPQGGLLGTTPKNPYHPLEPNKHYLRIENKGYADFSPSSQVASSSIAQLKHFIYSAIATGVLSEKNTIGFNSNQNKKTNLNFTITDNNTSESYALNCQNELLEFISNLHLEPNSLSIYDHSNSKTLLGGDYRPPETCDETASAIAGKIKKQSDFLSIPRDDQDVERIKASIEWWIDGSSNPSETISFLQYCIGFEALLGDNSQKNKQERGITERLADRFAFIRGNTQSQREEFRKQFLDVYDRRGKIVHQREIHLRRNEDSQACRKARSMLFLAINDEINSLNKAKLGKLIFD